MNAPTPLDPTVFEQAVEDAARALYGRDSGGDWAWDADGDWKDEWRDDARAAVTAALPAVIAAAEARGKADAWDEGVASADEEWKWAVTFSGSSRGHVTNPYQKATK